MEPATLARTIDRAKLHQVPELSLRYSNLDTLPESLLGLSDLTGLDLSDNYLTRLPDNLSDLTNLTWLNLDNNQLVNLPESLGKLTNLKRLNLYNNRLVTLPESIGNLSNLTRLNLYNNQLTSLPISLSNLTSLDWISLGNNPLTDLSILSSLINLKTLSFLDLDLPREYWILFSKDISNHILEPNNHKIARHIIEELEYIRTESIRVDRADRIYRSTRSNLLYRQAKLEEIIGLTRSGRILDLSNIGKIPENISNLIGKFPNINELRLCNNWLTILPENIGSLANLNELDLCDNQLIILPESIGNLIKLEYLYLDNNHLTSLPKNIRSLTSLSFLSLGDNPLIDLSILQELPNLKTVQFLNVDLPRRYWTKFSDWKPEWLLDEDNAEIRRILIEQVGYEKICDELNAITLDIWREYILLKIDGVEKIYDDEDEPIDTEPMVLLKMICPSTTHIHILRVPPEMESAEAAITWVNHGIHPDEFAVQT
jgi:leucine-rich repeat protein SHOC2